MRVIRWVFVALLAGLVLPTVSVGAQNTAQAETFTLPAGATATISFTAFCTQFGVDFPDTIKAPDSLADGKIRNALAYIQNKGLDDAANAEEAQYAIWRLSGATDSPQGGQVAAEIIAAAETALQEPTNATSLLDAVTSGKVEVTLASWQANGEPIQIGSSTDNFYGQGTMTVRNTSTESLTLYHPVGAQFAPTVAGEQTMAGYATDIKVDGAAAQATSAATATSAPTTAAAATSAPTSAATATSAPTTAAAATSAPTTAAAATSAPTTAAAATSAPTTAAAATPVSTPSAMPQTSNGEAGFGFVWAALALMALGMISFGWLATRRTRL